MLVTFAPNESQKTVDVEITNDDIREEDENFFGVLSLPPGSQGVELGQERATATIEDDDSE